MLLFALSAILGVAPAYDSSLSTPALVSILASVGLYFGITFLVRSQAAVRAAGTAGLLATTVFAVYFILQFDFFGYDKGGVVARIGQITTLLPNLGGFTPQPNAAATFLEVGAPLGIALTLSSRSRVSRISLTACTMMVAYAIFLTASRGAWLGLGLTAGLAFALTTIARVPRRTAKTLVVLGVAAAILGSMVVIVLGPDRLPFLSSTFSRATDRGRLFLNSLYLAGDYAFTGAGLGDTFAMVYSRFSLLIQVPFLTYAHNLPLSVWLNQGLLGLVALLAIELLFYVFVFRVHRSTRPPALFHGAWLGVTAALLHGLTDAPQYADSRWVMPMLFAWIGLAAASGQLSLRESAPDVLLAEAGTPARRVSLAVGAVALIAIIAFNRPLLAAWHTNLGAIAETRAELAPRLTATQRAEGYDAANAEYAAALAIEPAASHAARRAGNLAVKLDRFDEAVPLLESAYAAERSNPAAIKGLGLAYVWLGRSQDAADVLNRLDDPAAMSSELITWGAFRTEQGRPLLAAYAYETAQVMLPAEASVAVGLLTADAYRAANRVETARAWYNRVLEIEPGNERALSALVDLSR